MAANMLINCWELPRVPRHDTARASDNGDVADQMVWDVCIALPPSI